VGSVQTGRGTGADDTARSRLTRDPPTARSIQRRPPARLRSPSERILGLMSPLRSKSSLRASACPRERPRPYGDVHVGARRSEFDIRVSSNSPHGLRDPVQCWEPVSLRRSRRGAHPEHRRTRAGARRTSPAMQPSPARRSSSSSNVALDGVHVFGTPYLRVVDRSPIEGRGRLTGRPHHSGHFAGTSQLPGSDSN
jgi:hypothetical protein